jgi:hypothetical protein
VVYSTRISSRTFWPLDLWNAILWRMGFDVSRLEVREDSLGHQACRLGYDILFTKPSNSWLG